MERTIAIQEHISLKDHTTFKIGGDARYFVEVSTTQELTEAVTFAHEKNLPIFILGGGSNVLVSDEGFSGLVIKINISGKEILESNNDANNAEIIVGAGENWDEFVAYTVEQNLFGLENLSLIPGSVGAAPVQNIGAYGVEVKDCIKEVEVFNTDTNTLEKFSKIQCEFGYRDSIFKKPENKKYVITHVTFVLKKEKDAKLNIEYRDVKKYISEHAIQAQDITLKKVREIVIDIRTKKLPDVKKIGTAGSFFKNPIISQSKYEELLQQYPTMPGFATATEGEAKIPAAWILDNLCGFKGFREGNIGVYQNQALVLVNFGEGTAKEILNLSEKMIACVKEKTNIVLEKEVQII